MIRIAYTADNMNMNWWWRDVNTIGQS